MTENNNSIYYQEDDYKLYKGKMEDILPTLEAESIDSIITDPPYELNFMNKKWDNSGIAFKKETWEECFRVLRSGGYLLAFGGARTFHRIACAIEDAGFIIRDTIMWLYGEGMPKGMNIAKAISKRETELAKKWEGWNTQLKPCYEPIIVAQKPCENSIVDNIMKYGVGGINVNECRVGNEEISIHNAPKGTFAGGEYGRGSDTSSYRASVCRFPSNVILTYDDDTFDEVCGNMPYTKSTGGASTMSDFSKYNGSMMNVVNLKEPASRLESDYIAPSDEGNACRYFYNAKCSIKDREEGLDDFEEVNVHLKENGGNRKPDGKSILENSNLKRKNIHTTVKPTELMQYLVRLVSPKGATILDCFMGSGSTGKAVMFENRERNANYKFIGIEMTEEYLPIAKARIDYVKYKFEYEEKKEREELKQKGIQTIFDFLGDD